MSDLAEPRFGGAPWIGHRAGLARNWWALVLRGIVAILFALLAFAAPGVVAGSLVLILGIYLLADGVFGIVAAIRAINRQERWGLLLLEGIADLGLGLVAIFLPVLTLVVWIWALAAWAIVTGVLMLVSALRLDSGHGNWLMGLGGVVSVIWGGLLLFCPITGALALTIWLGAYALLFGISMIALGLRLRARHRQA
ncbi:HdeD family acid-resistance protein [Rhodovastum atsumiense]|uniref:HdeD family acid-resistance protein n=1 Tax=Rhodovastum atsumiense TaxID=504468 RepID=A0A5M6IW20_9PROT|nr:HdeD family acid-resistance protein [Rhodovastum atsumiense]KAA5611678.1 HdeD family acid-resistance protein [Rhodovastum atsumiense]CAH2604250.1 HdeD family acid-resistance protein [Rhodovastum atsumiense]